MAKIKIRVPGRINADGQWAVHGWTEWDEFKVTNSDCLKNMMPIDSPDEREFFIEAEIEVPETYSPVVQGTEVSDE